MDLVEYRSRSLGRRFGSNVSLRFHGSDEVHSDVLFVSLRGLLPAALSDPRLVKNMRKIAENATENRMKSAYFAS
jgi:hypothetical protein